MLVFVLCKSALAQCLIFKVGRAGFDNINSINSYNSSPVIADICYENKINSLFDDFINFIFFC